MVVNTQNNLRLTDGNKRDAMEKYGQSDHKNTRAEGVFVVFDDN